MYATFDPTTEFTVRCHDDWPDYKPETFRAFSHHDAAEQWCLSSDPCESVITVTDEHTSLQRVYRVNRKPSGWRIHLVGDDIKESSDQ